MRHLTGLATLTTGEILSLIEQEQRGSIWDPGTVALLFHEPSTRTRASFTQAALNVGLYPIQFDPEKSSEVKGETMLDTCKNLIWIGAKALVIRTSSNGLPAELAEQLEVPVINAGDGTNEHPTQALADARALLNHFGRIEGLTVAIVGDVSHSRVARSLAHLLTKLGARVHLVAAMCPADIPRDFASPSLDEGLHEADVVYVLRFQKERARPRDAARDGRYWGMLSEHEIQAFAKPTTMVMHPGPVLRGVDMTDGLLEGPRSLVRQQVESGVRARMRVFWLLLNGL